MRIIVILFIIALAACTVGPEYQRPERNAPERFVSQEVLHHLNNDKKNQEIPSNWWVGFSDKQLDKLVRKGLADNFEIKSAAARAKQAKASVKLADSGNAPTLSAGIDGGATDRHSIRNSSDRNTNSVAAALSAAVPLDLFGRTKRGVQSANAHYENALAELKGVVLGVSADIVSEYLTLRGTQQQLELLKESVALQEKTLSIVKSRLSSGIAPELDLQRAITSVENLRARIPPLEESLQNSRNMLATLTGNYPGVYESSLKDVDIIPSYRGLIPQVMPLDVLKTRPDVRQAEADLKSAIANIGVAEADFYPEFQLTGSIAFGLSNVTGAPTATTLISALGGVIDQFILDGGSRKAGLMIAKAKAEEKLADYEHTLRRSVAEVEAVLTAIDASKKRQSALQKSVASSQRSFSQAETLYQQGLISFLDVVDAQRVWADARQNLASEQTNHAVQVSSLFYVLGVEINHGKKTLKTIVKE